MQLLHFIWDGHHFLRPRPLIIIIIKRRFRGPRGDFEIHHHQHLSEAKRRFRDPSSSIIITHHHHSSSKFRLNGKHLLMPRSPRTSGCEAPGQSATSRHRATAAWARSRLAGAATATRHRAATATEKSASGARAATTTELSAAPEGAEKSASGADDQSGPLLALHIGIPVKLGTLWPSRSDSPAHFADTAAFSYCCCCSPYCNGRILFRPIPERDVALKARLPPFKLCNT